MLFTNLVVCVWGGMKQTMASLVCADAPHRRRRERGYGREQEHPIRVTHTPLSSLWAYFTPAPSPPVGVLRHVPRCRIKVEPPAEVRPAGHVDDPEGEGGGEGDNLCGSVPCWPR